MMDTALTTWKSRSVVSIMSFIQGASPMSRPDGSWRFRMPPSRSSWRSTSSLATLYAEFTSSSSHFPLFSFSVTLSGRNSSGTREPVTDSMPNTYCTPSTCSISRIMARTSWSGRPASTSSMWVDATPKSSLSFLLAVT